jgi:hypothetical protein
MIMISEAFAKRISLLPEGFSRYLSSYEPMSSLELKPALYDVDKVLGLIDVEARQYMDNGILPIKSIEKLRTLNEKQTNFLNICYIQVSFEVLGAAAMDGNNIIINPLEMIRLGGNIGAESIILHEAAHIIHSSILRKKDPIGWHKLSKSVNANNPPPEKLAHIVSMEGVAELFVNSDLDSNWIHAFIGTVIGNCYIYKTRNDQKFDNDLLNRLVKRMVVTSLCLTSYTESNEQNKELLADYFIFLQKIAIGKTQSLDDYTKIKNLEIDKNKWKEYCTYYDTVFPQVLQQIAQ